MEQPINEHHEYAKNVLFQTIGAALPKMGMAVAEVEENQGTLEIKLYGEKKPCVK